MFILIISGFTFVDNGRGDVVFKENASGIMGIQKTNETVILDNHECRKFIRGFRGRQTKFFGHVMRKTS